MLFYIIRFITEINHLM